MTNAVTRHPLLHGIDLDQVMMYRQQARVTAGQFIAEAQMLTKRLANHDYILNMCQDRYRFMVGLAAAALAGKVSLLPSTATDETSHQLHEAFPGTLRLHDQDSGPRPYPHLPYPDTGLPVIPASKIPWIDKTQLVAYVFTSGSTGYPMPHSKTWGKLVQNVQAATGELGLDRRPMTIVGTVPPQHMFGFESTVLLCLQGRCPLWSGKPFYPADISSALAAVPEPRMLVTTPFHLQSLLDAKLNLPRIDKLLLATAPLSPTLAIRAEHDLQASLLEIYGTTETGQIATRRPTTSAAWKRFPGIRLESIVDPPESEIYVASGGHIETEVALSDRLAMQPDGRFLLLGRIADQVNIAGKRSSLSFLTAQLKTIIGVCDGIFFQPDTQDDQPIHRLCALVVAPELPAAEILRALRERIDPIFLPRPLIKVERLPFNATGKLPRQNLQTVLDQYLEHTRP